MQQAQTFSHAAAATITAGELLAKASCVVALAETVQQSLVDGYNRELMTRQACDNDTKLVTALNELADVIFSPPIGGEEVATALREVVSVVKNIEGSSIGSDWEIRLLFLPPLENAARGLRAAINRANWYLEKAKWRAFNSIPKAKPASKQEALEWLQSHADKGSYLRNMEAWFAQRDLEEAAAKEAESHQRLAEMIAKMKPLTPQVESDTIEKLRVITLENEWESLQKAAAIANAAKWKTNDKLREIDRLIEYRNEATAEQIGAALEPKVTRANVCATKFWKEDLTMRRERDKKETKHGDRAAKSEHWNER